MVNCLYKYYSENPKLINKRLHQISYWQGFLEICSKFSFYNCWFYLFLSDRPIRIWKWANSCENVINSKYFNSFKIPYCFYGLFFRFYLRNKNHVLEVLFNIKHQRQKDDLNWSNYKIENFRSQINKKYQ